MVKKKRMSKRTPLKRKYNIMKRVKDHDKKIQRAAKKNPESRKSIWLHVNIIML